MKHHLKVLLTDIAGVFLIIISPITGMIPGPGGIPIFLAGLGLLAINHEWARKLLKFITTTGAAMIKRFFSENPLIKWLYDVLSVLAVFIGAWIIRDVTSNILEAVALVLIFAGLALFLGNRKRLENLIRWTRNKLKR